jgi:hypothetical protein
MSDNPLKSLAEYSHFIWVKCGCIGMTIFLTLAT